MSLIQAVNLSKAYGAQDVFSDLSVSIPQRARIGLVGANGVGKTTLLRILMGLEEPSAGEVQRARNLRIGYLPQEAVQVKPHTLWEECQQAFTSLHTLQLELRSLESEMRHRPQDRTVLEAYGKKQAEFEHLGGYVYETRIEQTLSGLGFDRSDYHRHLTQLSGGQRTRALLARLLLENPDLLLLDEPTNHLDISAIEWLEDYLRDWQGAALIVSHDRYFLDRAVNVIWEMTPSLEVYHGNYSAYLQQRSERYQRRLEEYQAQQALIEKEEEFIRRNLAGQNTRQAQGRRKRLERLLEEARLTLPMETRRIHLKLQPVTRSGDLVVRTSRLSIGYADEGRPLFHVPDLILQRGECAAILGPNGAGKTTFLKTLLGQVPPYSGEVVLGASLRIGYFAQAHEGLHPERTLMQEIEAVAPNLLPAEIRNYLAKFLFSGDDVFKTVETLSGGERSRLALACLALQGANLLLLDEPTNHLDLPSQEALQAVLADYQGTILLVSHDRYLIDALATQIWEVMPDEAELRIFNGTYSEYKAARQAEAIVEQASRNAPTQRHSAGAQPSPARPSAGTSKEAQRKHRQRIQALEEEIAALEAQMKAISRRLEQPPADPLLVQKLGQEYVALERALEQRLEVWDTLTRQEKL
jgi:ATP-binding cassette subfamily F protein 3